MMTSIALLGGCGGGGGSDVVVPTPKAAGIVNANGKSTIASVSAQAEGTVCPTGGSKIESGIDSNGNGVLDPGEVASTQYVCNGADGAAGAAGKTSLVSMQAEPAGANCAAGGTKVSAGVDTNGNGALDAQEVSSTGYVCQGATGGAGAAGAPGALSLIAIAPEPAGAHCAAGGNAVSSGVDLNGNGVLDPAEVSATQYVCNGAASVPWIDVSSLTYQASPNEGYLADSASQVVITLPASPQVGDVVRFNGIGAGGFKVAQNAGQSVLTQSLPGNIEFAAGDTTTPFYSLATSADGRIVYAGSNGPIYRSTDSGKTYTPTGAPALYWHALATSADGTKVFTGNIATGNLYYSSDSGASFAVVGTVATNWYAVSMSADGTRLFACDPTTGLLYVSTDSGASFTSPPQTGSWATVASSADGLTLIASDDTSGGIWLSTDGGTTFALTAIGSGAWHSLAISADGHRIIATDANDGRLAQSTDTGATWSYSYPGGNYLQGVSMSADGRRMMVGSPTNSGQLLVSSDFGASFEVRGVIRDWALVRVSGDGQHMYGASYNYTGPVFAAANVGDATTVGTSGSITGYTHDALELQYIGDGQFTVLSSNSYSGAFSVQ